MPQWMNMPKRACRHQAMRASCCAGGSAAAWVDGAFGAVVESTWASTRLAQTPARAAPPTARDTRDEINLGRIASSFLEGYRMAGSDAVVENLEAVRATGVCQELVQRSRNNRQPVTSSILECRGSGS